MGSPTGAEDSNRKENSSAPFECRPVARQRAVMREVLEKQKEDAVFLVVDEWVNKTLNFRNSTLFYGDPRGEPVFEFDRWVPYSNLGDFMNQSFPWMEFEYAERIDDGSIEVEGHILEVKVGSFGRSFP